MSIEWQRKMNPREVLHSTDGRGIIPQARIWLLLREDLSEKERYELAAAALTAFQELKTAGQAPWNTWGQGYDPPQPGNLCYLKLWIEEGPFPEIPAIRPPWGERYFLRNNHGNRDPSKEVTAGRVFLVKHHLRAPLDVGLHAEQRLKVAAAVAAWQGLSQPEKEIWRRHSYAKAFHLTGYCTFISFHTRGKI